MTTLTLPLIPYKLLNRNWYYRKKEENSKIYLSALALRALFASMVGMHVHTLSGKKREDIHLICETKYHELVASAI